MTIYEPLLILSVRAIEEPSRWWTEVRAKRKNGETIILKVTGCTPQFWTEKSVSVCEELFVSKLTNQDVIRFEDDSNRTSGKIESEHEKNNETKSL